MKKIYCLILSLITVFTLSFTSVAYASEPTYTFEFSSEDAISSEIATRLSRGESDFTIERTFPTSEPGVSNEISIRVWTTTANESLRVARATDTVNWALSGRYYLISNDETISNYGNHGSVDYTGSSLQNAHWEVYHDLTYKYADKYTATATDSEVDVSNGTKFLGKYKLKNKSTGNYAETAEIYIIVKNDGHWESKGNFGAIHVD